MPSDGIDIPQRLTRTNSSTVSSSYKDTFSTSPQNSYHGPPKASAKQLKPFQTTDINVLLLENVNLAG